MKIRHPSLPIQPIYLYIRVGNSPTITNKLTLAVLFQLGFPSLPDSKPEGEALDNEQTLKDLHRLLLETHVTEGKLTCGNCGHSYMIKEGIANFLLPSHLGEKSSFPLGMFVC